MNEKRLFKLLLAHNLGISNHFHYCDAADDVRRFK